MLQEGIKGKIGFVAVLIVLAAVIFSVIALYDKGYRLRGFRILFPATITVVDIPKDARLLFDSRQVEGLQAGESSVTIDTVSGTHTVGVAKDGYFPWQKEIELMSASVATVRPFLLPRDSSGNIIPENDPEYKKLSAAFSSSLPRDVAPAISSDHTMGLYVEGNTIMAKYLGDGEPPAYFCTRGKCDDTHKVLVFDAQVRSLDFLPKRNDVALFAAQNGIFALELDTRGTQNFQPLYKGSRPSFTIVEGIVYAKDGALFEILTHLRGE